MRVSMPHRANAQGLVGDLTVAEIAPAFLVQETAMGQRRRNRLGR
jgi:predicted RNA polymerase sigma factor